MGSGTRPIPCIVASAGPAGTRGDSMAIDMSQFYQVFFDESAEHLAAMETLLLELDVEHPDPEDLNAIFRAAHSIKGSAGTFGFNDLAQTTHILENLLDRIRKNELPLQAAMVDAFLETGDLLKTMLAAHQGQGEVDPVQVEAMCGRLRRLSSETEAARPDEVLEAARPPAEESSARSHVHTYEIDFVPTAASARAQGVGNFIDDLLKLGEVEVLTRPQGDADVGRWRLRLRSAGSPEAFCEQLDFIADSGAWKIEEGTSGAGDQDGSYGFFGDAPGVPGEEEAYGLFDQPAESGAEPPTDDSFGFFEPVPADSGQTEPYGFFEPITAEPYGFFDQTAAAEPGPQAESEAYGLFAPLPASEPPQVRAEAAGEEGAGYGFFAPLPVPVAASTLPVSSASKAADKPVATKQTRGPAPAATGTDSSIRVSVEKVDQLINLVGELVITQAMLLQTAEKMQESAPERLLNGLSQLERNTRDLQEAVMSIRMLPISFVFSRFPRVVRDLSGKLGKQVELKTSGETTELDKGLIERIADPLTHLIRNSLDHGIEMPEQRIAVGKSPVGTITLKACHQGGNIVIEVGDDGAGLNRQKILAKARERGLPVSDQMSDQEVFGLIFEAGFSTAEQVTDVSGRGVGMDVVRKNILAMGGRVDIESMPGIGTRMTVRLPLTLAILDGMSVAVGDQTYILPLSAVTESLQPKAGDIRTLSNQARVVQVRGEYLPVLVLHELFNLQSCWSDFTQGIMVVLDADGTRAALFVDALLGQHQVVIKSLEANYRRVTGISGATIMGDGRVALILDVSAIAGMLRNQMQAAD